MKLSLTLASFLLHAAVRPALTASGGVRGLQSTPSSATLSGSTTASSSFNWRNGGFARFPALSEFGFEFHNGEDNHINAIAVEPIKNSVNVIYQDRGRDDRYFFTVTGVELPEGTTFQKFEGESTTSTVTTSFTPPADTVSVIQSFQMQYTDNDGNDDHHVGQTAVRVLDFAETGDRTLNVIFRDVSHNDDYRYKIWVAHVPRSKATNWQTVTGTQSSNSQGLSGSTSGSVPMIGGFSITNTDGNFAYTIEDSHVSAYGVRVSDSSVEVTFTDKGGEVNFDFEVDVVYITN